MPGNGKKMLLMTLNRVIIGLCRWVSISETASSDCDVFVRMKYSRWPSQRKDYRIYRCEQNSAYIRSSNNQSVSIYYLPASSPGVLDRCQDKRSNLKTSLWAVRNCDEHFLCNNSLTFNRVTTGKKNGRLINNENICQLQCQIIGMLADLYLGIVMPGANC